MRKQFLIAIGLIWALVLGSAPLVRADSFSVGLGYYDTTHGSPPVTMTFGDNNALLAVKVGATTTGNPNPPSGLNGAYDGGFFIFNNPTGSPITVSGLTVEMKSALKDVVWTFSDHTVGPNSSLAVTQATISTGLNPLSALGSGTNTSPGEFFDGSELGPTGNYSKNTSDFFTATVKYSIDGGATTVTMDGTPLFGKSPDGNNESLNLVPEPGSVILFGMGAIALAGCAARRRRRTMA
jgi:hypothetical protein